jgi:hypothetical protein
VSLKLTSVTVVAASTIAIPVITFCLALLLRCLADIINHQIKWIYMYALVVNCTVHTQDGGSEAEERARHDEADWRGALSRRGLSHRLLQWGAAERRQPSRCLQCFCSHPCCLLHRNNKNDDGSHVDQRDVHYGACYPGVVPVSCRPGLTNAHLQTLY